ncbi:hypothetical protein B0H21DRAFT_137373 [Amylocystis lapponica]|nr:hypothetical protein B0H21DRAFT_137373 [Amylocystis lapponica]
MSAQQPITIRTFSQGFCVAGGYLEGVVELYFPVIQSEEIQEIHVKLRGIARTVVHRNNRALRETHALVRQNCPVWTRGDIYPEPGSHTLQLPFKFRLADDLPPAFVFTGMVNTASINYFLEAVGVRSGVLRMNRRVVQPLAVLPPDVAGSQLRSQLQAGWTGPWKTIVRQERVRKGIWGDYANVKMEFSYPAIEQFPLFTRIPFTLKIRTVSKPMKPEDTSDNKPIFPAPPAQPREVQFNLERRTHMQAREWSYTSGDSLPSIGGMGTSLTPCNVEILEKIWRPTSDSGKGVWVQETMFSSAILLKCPPTFRFDTISISYDMHLQVNFGGLFNSLSVDMPVTVVSGMHPSQDHADYPSHPPPVPHVSPFPQSSPVPQPSPPEYTSQPPAFVLDLPP